MEFQLSFFKSWKMMLQSAVLNMSANLENSAVAAGLEKVGFHSNPKEVQFSSVAQSCPTLCNAIDCSKPGFPVYHQLPEPAQTYVHWVGDAIQPSHPLSSPSPPDFSLSQHQGLFAVILETKIIKSLNISILSPSICHEVMGPDAMILVFSMLRFKTAFFNPFFHVHQETL